MRMQLNAQSNPWDVVFPSSTGTLRDPHNVRRQWREARGDAFAWVTPHAFRKTVATLIDRERGDHDASAQLGHSGTAVTRKHYIEKAVEAPDLTAVLNQLG
jgi:integrase